MNHTISKGKLLEWIQDGIIAILDHNGDKETEEYLWGQLDEGWRVGVVVEPISNTIVKTWVVCTANHRDHHGFDAGACVEIVSEFEEEPEVYDDFNGTVFEVE